MKNLKLLGFTVLLVSLSHSAWALPGFLDVFATDNNGSTTPISAFSDGNTPHIYTNVSIPASSSAATSSSWNAPSGATYFTLPVNSTSSQRWIAPSDWANQKEAGNWKLFVNYFDSQGNNEVRELNFTVTPEPMTLSLFGLGLLPLMRLRKKTLTTK